jgi:hypothetical protein
MKRALTETYNYPSLKNQFNLSPKSTLKKLPPLYEDATHNIYIGDTFVIKQIRTDVVKNSVFWQVMATEFHADLFSQFNKFEQIYQQLTNISPLAIPKLLKKVQNPAKGFFASSAELMLGRNLQTSDLNPTIIKQLAQHLAACHQQGLIMPDLRWDQFLTDGKTLTSLVDLDAIITGPIEIEWVILEYLLNEQQANIFYKEYSNFLVPPNIASKRKVHRHLLFKMNILGETNQSKWMAHPIIFD